MNVKLNIPGYSIRVPGLMVLCLVTLLLTTACADGESTPATSADQPDAIVLTGVNVLTMKDDSILEGKTVVIRGDRIESIRPDEEAEIPEDAMQVDSEGKYLMPGLAEMHGHIPGPDDSQYAKDVLFLYISNGVTTVRNMAGHPYHLELSEQVMNGEIPGPVIYAASPWLSPDTIPDTDAVEGVVQGYLDEGFDLMKMGSLSLETYRKLAEVAHEEGLPFAGHIPEEVGLRVALDERQASIDHLDRYVEFLAEENPDAENISPGFFGSAIIDYVEEERLDEAIELTIEAGTWNVPTLSLVEHLESTETPEEMAQWPEMQYMPRSVIEGWISSKHDFQARDDFQPEAARKLVELRQKITKELHDRGALIVLGSDAPQFFNVPGFSIHHEMEMMVATGLSPYEVLVTGTKNAGIYFDEEDEFGMIEEGLRADLILLNSNPFEDIANVKNRAGVIVRGEWWPEDKIQDKLGELARE
ncbi:MAG: amidohydrolase family protein [Balneolaceae bacterium]|nr:amidohydrolase family protein [Balneolaceae bacterium]MCH8548002.1 amidohydrolase family protein [Balneolaceae bacterium]